MKDRNDTLFSFFMLSSIILIVMLSVFIGYVIVDSIVVRSSMSHQYELESASDDSNSRTINPLDKKAIVEFLRRNNVQNDVDFDGDYSTWNSAIQGLLIMTVNNSESVVCGLCSNQLRQLPKNALIVLEDRCIILDKMTDSKVWVWDPKVNAVVEYSASKFSKIYYEADSPAFMITSRGYQGDI